MTRSEAAFVAEDGLVCPEAVRGLTSTALLGTERGKKEPIQINGQ